jgi:uncharacterized protein YaaN involved in tellurite resistance
MSSNSIAIAFPEVSTGTALAIPDAPSTPANTGLSQFAANPVGVQKGLVCHSLLMGDTLSRANKEAADLLVKMLANTAIFSTYGTQALAGVNQLIDQLLKNVGPVDIPELHKLMANLNSEMRSVRSKYDVSDPHVREKYEHWKGGLGRFVGRGQTLIALLMEDVTSVEHQMDRVADQLQDRQQELVRNVTYYDSLYEQNEAEIDKLIYAIAVMELIRDQAGKQATAMPTGDASLGDRRGEQQASLLQFANNMDVKIVEYKGRLMIAWSTSPQVRMMRTLNVGLAERINELINVTIPTMKATILQWRMLVQSHDAATLSEEVQKGANEWIQAYEAAGAELVPVIAKAVQTPTLTPQTIAAVADSVAKQATGIIEAMQMGAARRQELEQTMLQAQQVLANANTRISQAEIDEIVGQATKPIEVADHVPALPSAN